MEKSRSKARLFVALDLPGNAREQLDAWRARALDHEDLRLGLPTALHVTLVFLGYVDEGLIPRVSELMEPPPVSAPVLSAVAVKPLPPRQPRLFAVDLSDEGGRAAEIQRALSDALEREGLYEPEKRPFWPHVTVARVRKGARVRDLDVPDPPAEPWTASSLTLYRSRLSPRGARYEPVEVVQLGR